VTVRPTRGCAGAVLVAIVLNLLARVTGDAWLALGSAAAIVLPVASLLVRPPLHVLNLDLRGPRSVLAGTPVEQVLVVTNCGRLASPPCTWRDGIEVAVPALVPGETLTVPVPRPGLPRGRYDGTSATLTTTAPFGLLRWVRPAPHASILLVHPRTDRGRRLRPGGRLAGTTSSTPVAGSGLEILGLRPWRAGDSSRAVSQRATARHGRPVVLEREREASEGPGLLVLASGGSRGAEWERQVSYAASVAIAAVRAGRPVTLLAGQGGPVPPRALDVTAVLDFFAAVDGAGRLDPHATRAAQQAYHPGGTVLQLRGLSAGLQINASSCCHHEVLDA
jgi:uncharacterized protein (DUF58 family)